MEPSVTPIKIPEFFFCEIEKLILKVSNFKREEQRGLSVADFK